MANPRIGLLPLYLELYDDVLPKVRSGAERFLKTIAGALRDRGVAVTEVPVCRLKNEFRRAVRTFENANVDLIVTLHLAYSPSLESADVLEATLIPVVVLDTTPDFDFGPRQQKAAIMRNHGIHGVQDLCNLLKRKGKSFQIEAGHWEKSDVLDRVAGWADSAVIAASLRTAKVGQLGNYFTGMGDFAVPAEKLLSTIGIRTVSGEPSRIRSFVPEADAPEVVRESSADLKNFAAKNVKPDVLRRANVAGLAVRRWVEQEHLSAVTVNFRNVEKEFGLPAIPFLEAGKMMAKGIGYAGEGDVLTAALVAGLARVYPETTFTEMFCPDWRAGSVFLNHMGEVNPNLLAGTPCLTQVELPFAVNKSQVIITGRLKSGSAVIVNLAPGANDKYTLLIAPVSMLGVRGTDNLAGIIRGWAKPAMPVADFLAEYSRAGGTHHSALVYGAEAGEIERFGKLMDWETIILY